VRVGVDETGSGSCPVAGFGISGVEPLREAYENTLCPWPQWPHKIVNVTTHLASSVEVYNAWSLFSTPCICHLSVVFSTSTASRYGGNRSSVWSCCKNLILQSNGNNFEILAGIVYYVTPVSIVLVAPTLSQQVLRNRLTFVPWSWSHLHMFCRDCAFNMLTNGLNRFLISVFT
jgi:hypothetical protein